MKKLLQAFLCASLLFVAFGAVNAASDCCNDTTDCCDCACSSIFIPRSAGDNLRRQAVYRNFNADAELADDCCWGNTVFGVDYTYQRSRKGNDIARSLFGNNILNFQGSAVAGRSATALIADNFGLSPLTNQQIGFCPRITNNIIDFELYFELNNWCNGLFMQFNAPVVVSKFQLRAFDAAGLTITTNNCSTDCSTGCSVGCSTGCDEDCGQVALPFPASASFCPGVVAPALINTGSALALNTVRPVASFQAALADFGLSCESRDTKLASFNMILGYNAWECEDYNVGIFLRAAAPTGTDNNCCDLCCDNRGLFAAQIGDNHWKLGGGLTGRYDLYNCDDNHYVTIYAEGYAEHLFKRCQVRSFDFIGGGCLSRFMQLNEFTAAGVATGNTISGLAFATRNVKTSVDIQGEGQIEVGYRNNCGFSAGLGWNIYGRSGEEACTIGSPCDPTVIGKQFGFKGCAPVSAVCVNYLVDTSGIAHVAGFSNRILSSTSSTATAVSCGTIDNEVVIPAVPTTISTTPGATGTVCINVSQNVDGVCSFTALPAIGATVSTLTATDVTFSDIGLEVRATQSSTPVLFDTTSAATLDINSGLARSQITNKVFGHLDYQWDECRHTPKVYVGGEVEFASSDRCAGMNAWAIFLGGSMNF